MTKGVSEISFGADTEILLFFQIWRSDNPDDYKNNEDCIEMRLDHRKWNDVRFDHVTQFVCEKDINYSIVSNADRRPL